MRSSAAGLPAGWFVETPPIEGVRGILSAIGTSGDSKSVRMGVAEYLVMQGIGVSGFYDGKSTPSVFYELVGSWSFAPQISDDGRRMVTRSGSAMGGNDGFGVHSWNLANGKTIVSGSAMNSGRQTLSSDTLQFATLTVYNTEQTMPQDIQKPWKDNPAGLLMVYDTNRFILGDASQGRGSDEVPGKRFITDLAAMRTIVWTSDNRILYTHAPAVDNWSKEPNDDFSGGVQRFWMTTSLVIDAPNKYPSVWIANARTKATHQVVARAYDPSPSPDGKYIAFFGWPVEEKPTVDKPASVPRLWLYEVKTHKRFAVNGQNAGYVGWTRDSHTLVMGDFETPRQLHIGSVALRDALLGAEHVGSLKVEKAVVDVPNDGTSLWPRDPIEFGGIARNGRYVVVNTTASKVAEGQEGFQLEYTLLAVDLQNGHISTIAHAKPTDYVSWSWFDESDAPVEKK